MKKAMILMAILLVSSFLVSMIAVAPLIANEKIDYGQTPKQSQTQTPPKTQTPDKSKSVGSKFTKLNPRDLAGTKSPKALGPKFYAEWKKITDASEELALGIPLWEEYAKKYVAKCEACKIKAYTEADKTAAGCLSSDSVAVCSQKLFKQCTHDEFAALAYLYESLYLHLSTLNTSSKIAQDELYKSANNVVQ